jgi:hypothetical protein
VKAQTTVLGAAAAAALSGTATAVPCPMMAANSAVLQGVSCTVTEANVNPAEDRQQTESRPESSSGQTELLPRAPEADVLADPEVFTGSGIKITNLQATMTSNKYVAGRLPVAVGRPIEEIIMFSPDYLTIKTLAPLPKRNPVGVGLVTVPKRPTKESDKTPEVPGIQPKRP